MPDIAMCTNDACPLAPRCYRHEAKPARQQSYADFAPDANGECKEFWEMERRNMSDAALYVFQFEHKVGV